MDTVLSRVLEVIDDAARDIGALDVVYGLEPASGSRVHPMAWLPSAQETVSISNDQRVVSDRVYRRHHLRRVRQEVVLFTQESQVGVEELLMALLAALPEAVEVTVDGYLTDHCPLHPITIQWLGSDALPAGEQGVKVCFKVELGMWRLEEAAGEALPTQLFLGIAPEIGADHEEDYFPLGELGTGSPESWNLIPGA